MKIAFQGGFGEKGRTSVGIETPATRIMLDAGINTSSRRDYYPAVTPEELARTRVLFITHAHEDHIGGLGWCLANGFSGDIFMTRPTRDEMDGCLAAYAEPAHRELANKAPITIIEPGQKLTIGDLAVTSGRSGHAVGGLWFRVEHGEATLVYGGDTVAESPVLAMDPIGSCDALIFDASYGDDPISGFERGAQIRAWIAAHRGACILPTPLSGKPLEILALIDTPVAIHASMREPILAQLSHSSWLRPGVAALIKRRLATATDWTESKPFPRQPLLVHDGMGMAGPSAIALERAKAQATPVLLTGHLPTGSPGERMLQAAQAEWIRLPTHPTLLETLAMLRVCQPRLAFGHSCDEATLHTLAKHLGRSLMPVRTGQSIKI